MAYTIERTPAVIGSRRAVFLKMTADAATQAVETGLDYILHVEATVASAASSRVHNFQVNKNASAVAANGTLGISGAVSGDVIYVTVYGR